MEPWDGPAAMAFSDGRQIGATLDRNGPAPGPLHRTDEGLVIMASEVGVLPCRRRRSSQMAAAARQDAAHRLRKDRIVSDDELKQRLATANPYRKWLAKTQIVLEELPEVGSRAPATECLRCSIASRLSATRRKT
jgi:glutamate synthase (NADPH/NADH) large chain